MIPADATGDDAGQSINLLWQMRIGMKKITSARKKWIGQNQ